MIKANELRIGNIIRLGGNTLDTYQTYKPHIVCADTIMAIKDENDDRGDDYILSVFQPVELTPEILEAAGFSKRNNGTSIDYHIGINEVTKDWLFYLVWIDGFKYPFYRNGRHQIKYLHQLQNLYQSLCGEELQIDINKLNK